MVSQTSLVTYVTAMVSQTGLVTYVTAMVSQTGLVTYVTAMVSQTFKFSFSSSRVSFIYFTGTSMCMMRTDRNHTKSYFSRHQIKRRNSFLFFFFLTRHKETQTLTNNQNSRCTHLSTKQIHFDTTHRLYFCVLCSTKRKNVQHSLSNSFRATVSFV